MIDYLKKFERGVNVALIIMLAVVIVLALIDVLWMLIQDVSSPPYLLLRDRDLLDLFGFFMLVLIGLELLETIKRYYVEGRIELKVIFTVALFALGRKIIIMDPDKYDGLTLIGMGAIILALVAGYYVASGRGLRFRRDGTQSESRET